MNPLKKLASQTAIYGLSSVVGRLLNYLLVPLYTRYFLPEEYGVVTELYAYVAFLVIILTYGLETAFFRFSQIEKNNSSTWFTSKITKLHARKKWIISSVAPKGALIIDDGAKKALKSGKSLLAAGIKKVSGRFNKGDHIKVLDKKNNECARGLSSFTSDEVTKIMGHHSNEIEKLLGYVAKSEVIHKDDMVEI